MADRLTPAEQARRDAAALPPITDPVLLRRIGTILRSAVATPPSAASTGRPRARRSNPATKNAPDHAGKRAVGGVS